MVYCIIMQYNISLQCGTRQGLYCNLLIHLLVHTVVPVQVLYDMPLIDYAVKALYWTLIDIIMALPNFLYYRMVYLHLVRLRVLFEVATPPKIENVEPHQNRGAHQRYQPYDTRTTQIYRCIEAQSQQNLLRQDTEGVRIPNVNAIICITLSVYFNESCLNRSSMNVLPRS